MKRKPKNEAVQGLDITAALGSITKEKSISMDLVLDSLKDALASGAKRYLGKPVNVEVKVDKEKGAIEVYARRTVVDVVENPETQIHIDEAKGIDPELEVGDELIQDLDVSMFGRTAIQTAKQVIVQRVREAERERVFHDFSERIGELVTGTVQQIEKGSILVNLGRTEAILPYKEQIHKERYRQGDTLKGCIVDVKDNAKGPQVIVSRTCPEFLARLFELEVPEIFDKTVKIVKVVRDPGHRSKIAVATTDERVDPVGACVGMRGNRVQAIVRELSNERIDIINWTTEISLLVRRVFSPAEVKRVHEINEKKVVVIIKEEDLAQAIGREGQNIRLASRLLDREVDVYGDEEFAALTESQREQALSEAGLTEESQAAAAAAADAAEGGGIAATEVFPDTEDEQPPEVAVEKDEEAEALDDPNVSVQDRIVENAVEALADDEKDVSEAIDSGEAGAPPDAGSEEEAGIDESGKTE